MPEGAHDGMLELVCVYGSLFVASNRPLTVNERAFKTFHED